MSNQIITAKVERKSLKKAFKFLQWCFFGEIPKKIPLPQPKPKASDVPKTEHWQFVEKESHDSCMTWKSDNFKDKTRPSATVETPQSEPIKQPTLTKNDELELTKRGLDIGKAITIKPYWFNEISRFNAANAINIKGFSESIIAKYYASFNAIQSIENQ
jgi:hypothetical protein